MDELQQSIMLWLPSYMVEDDEAVADVTRANGLVMDLLGGSICYEQLMDEFNDIGVDLDDYQNNIDRLTK